MNSAQTPLTNSKNFFLKMQSLNHFSSLWSSPTIVFPLKDNTDPIPQQNQIKGLNENLYRAKPGPICSLFGPKCPILITKIITTQQIGPNCLIDFQSISAYTLITVCSRVYRPFKLNKPDPCSPNPLSTLSSTS